MGVGLSPPPPPRARAFTSYKRTLRAACLVGVSFGRWLQTLPPYRLLLAVVDCK